VTVKATLFPVNIVVSPPGAATASIEIGSDATQNRIAYLDFVTDTTFTDFGFRILRDNTGPNAETVFTQRGTGTLSFRTSEASSIEFFTSSISRFAISALGTATFAGTVIPATGTATLAPVDYSPGVLLTTPINGAIEYTGKAFYSTTDTGRGVEPSVSVAAIQTALTLSDVNTAQSWLPAANDLITLQGDTTYEFEGTLILATGATTHTTAISFLAAGGLTVTSFEYTANLWSAAANTISTTQSTTHVSGIASKVLNATSTAVRTVIEFKGIARINVGGTLAPQFTNSAVTGGTVQVLLGSYIKFTPWGAGNVQAIGAWS
jgi:hypothetical protein